MAADRCPDCGNAYFTEEGCPLCFVEKKLHMLIEEVSELNRALYRLDKKTNKEETT